MLKGTLFQPGQVRGTGTNDNAAAGNVGEYITATVVAGSAVALTTATTANVTSLPNLAPGDYDISVTMDLTPAATTSITVMTAGISTTSATLLGQAGNASVGTDPQTTWTQPATVPAAGPICIIVPPCRVTLAAITTIFFVANCTFTVAALSAYGTIRARRIR